MRPICTALTSVPKLSSVRIMRPACFVTSLPDPMATPMSACFERGGVVDRVAGHRHDQPLLLHDASETELVLG